MGSFKGWGTGHFFNMLMEPLVVGGIGEGINRGITLVSNGG